VVDRPLARLAAHRQAFFEGDDGPRPRLSRTFAQGLAMTTETRPSGATDAPTLFADCGDRRLAYRSIGTGKPIVLCTRFRGNLDTWDPAFLDALADRGFRVVTFDYSGLGRSTGHRDYAPPALARDAIDLIEALDLRDVVIGGWSLGGMAAQIVVTTFPDRISHAVLLGTTPPGRTVVPAEQLFFDTARVPDYSFEDEVVLFFEPRSRASVAAARLSAARIAQRRHDRSVPVPADWAAAFLGDRPRNPPFPADAVLAGLERTTIPILHVGGAHDIIFPVENWYALNRRLPTVQLLTWPLAGHGPQHQHPDATAGHIETFVRTTGR
jgi:pimeloyl-ACP methyl ester carboxylesterase